MHLLAKHLQNMHLFQNLPKYAFVYADMQMHNYPKPSYNNHGYNEITIIRNVFAVPPEFVII